MKQQKYVAYVGTYTHENSVGIHIYDVDTENVTFKERKVVPINNPSDLVVTKDKKFLYSIADEGVQSFKILPDGDLEAMNSASIGGIRGCFVDVDDENRFLFVGGHHDGRVTMMRLREDGSIDGIAQGIFHQGMGRSIAQRNFIPRVDCVKLTPDQKFLCAVDNGLDHVKVYRVDYEHGSLKVVNVIRGRLESAPRQMRFSRNGRFAYILYELTNEVEVYEYSVKDDLPVFKKIQTISTMAEIDDDVCAASGIELSYSGKYLYCSNAGTNSVVCYEINPETGVLTTKFNTRVNSDYPKVLSAFPDENYFVVLNNNSNEIMFYQAFYEKGYALWKGKPISIANPNCIYITALSQE